MMKSALETQFMAMKGYSDFDFVAMMKKHHQHGIEMAQSQFASGKDSRAMAFAKKDHRGPKKGNRSVRRMSCDVQAHCSKIRRNWRSSFATAGSV